MEDNKKIRTREEIPEEDKWNLTDLFPSDEDWEAELKTIAEDQAYMASFAGKLGQSPEKLYAYLQRFEAVKVKANLLGNYCMRKADQDTRNATYQAMNGKFSSVFVELRAATSFETPEIMAIPEETLEQFYQALPELERYRRFLTDLRRRKAHTLSAAEEKLLAAAGEMAESPDKIFGVFSNADLTFPDAVDSRGETYALTQGTFVALEKNPDRISAKAVKDALANLRRELA